MKLELPRKTFKDWTLNQAYEKLEVLAFSLNNNQKRDTRIFTDQFIRCLEIVDNHIERIKKETQQ